MTRTPSDPRLRLYDIAHETLGPLGSVRAPGFVSALAEYLTVKPSDPRIVAVGMAPKLGETTFHFGQGRYTVKVRSPLVDEHNRLAEIWQGKRCPNGCTVGHIHDNGERKLELLSYSCTACGDTWGAAHYYELARAAFDAKNRAGG